LEKIESRLMSGVHSVSRFTHPVIFFHPLLGLPKNHSHPYDNGARNHFFPNWHCMSEWLSLAHLREIG
jgi:hypothetical protein